MENAAILQTIAQGAEILHLPPDKIAQNPYQPRRYFDSEGIRELADSIRVYGVLQPVTVRLIHGSRYELVAGERRLRASRLLGLPTIPAIAVSMTDRDSAVLALVENLQRKDLSFMEEAEGLANLQRDYGLTQEEIARQIGKKQSTVANKLRLLRLPEEVKRVLNQHGLTERHARALLKLEGDPEAQLDAALRVARDEMNVAAAEAFIERAAGKRGAPRRRVTGYLRDIRVFTNTIKQGVDMMKHSGLLAEYEVEEQAGGCFISIMISQPGA